MLLTRAHYTLPCEWHLRPLSDTCDAIWWPNLPFHSIFGSVIVFSSYWYDVWQRIIGSLSSIIVSFFLFLPKKVHVYPLFFWFYNFSPYVFYCLFSSLALLYIKKNYVFNLVLQLQFDNLSYIIFFQIRSLFFWFLIYFSLALLLNFYWFSILSSNQSLYCFILFNLGLILFSFLKVSFSI